MNSAARTVVPALVTLFMVTAAVRSAHSQPLGYGIGGIAGYTGWFGSRSNSGSVAGGGEFLVDGVAGAGVEFGLFDRLTVLSINGTLHLGDHRAHRASPFITGGYSRMGISDGEGGFDAWNIAGGVDFWARHRVGVRAEFRDHIRQDVRGTVQYWSLRAGVVFR